MKSVLFLLDIIFAASATKLLDRNLVYRSPFLSHPQVRIIGSGRVLLEVTHRCELLQFSHDTREIQARHIRSLNEKRRVQANEFTDDAYPTFYGADFSNVSGLTSTILQRPVSTYHILRPHSSGAAE